MRFRVWHGWCTSDFAMEQSFRGWCQRSRDKKVKSSDGWDGKTWEKKELLDAWEPRSPAVEFHQGYYGRLMRSERLAIQRPWSPYHTPRFMLTPQPNLCNIRQSDLYPQSQARTPEQENPLSRLRRQHAAGQNLLQPAGFEVRGHLTSSTRCSQPFRGSPREHYSSYLRRLYSLTAYW